MKFTQSSEEFLRWVDRVYQSKTNSNNAPIPIGAIKQLRGSMKAGAKRRGYSWELEDEDLCYLVAQNCYYCGSEPKNKSKTTTKKFEPFFYTGLDRVDNSDGYHLENIVPCCKLCNIAKSKYTQVDF